ncbi:outer membrane beta-barrel protein [Vibrio japonicus]|uniref:Outer membrane beta-barrel protein n=1 Tax=Vibrio japonicus TaxID=1824638 RepID=A0ABY5LQW9_9VIBR|nr:outer membrane beta-barrel protein [Vibrio japonicus]UUM33094.1 outer membrane beta-barrel protein [Vibrio japonicus]
MNKPQLSILAVLLTSCFHSAQASESNGYITESGLKLVPILDSRFEYNDNIGRYSDAKAPESSSVFVLEPGISVESDRGGNQYSVAYQLSSGTYLDSSDDNYIDHTLSTNNFIRLNSRNGVALNYSYQYSHEERGTGLLAGDELSTATDEPVKFAIHNVNGTYVYGSEQAKGRVELTLGYEDREYKNYRDTQLPGIGRVSTKHKDHRELSGALAFYYRVMPATSLIFEVDTIERRYDLNDPITDLSQDSVDIFYLLGATWEATGKTTGKLRLGLQDKSYDESTKEDFQGFSWDLDVIWKPVKHSTVTLSGAQRARDSDQGTVYYVDEKSLYAGWKHYWLNNFYSNLSVQLRDDDYSNSQRFGQQLKRDDELFKSGINFGYEIFEHADISLGWNYENNDSSLESNNYKQNVMFISANANF